VPLVALSSVSIYRRVNVASTCRGPELVERHSMIARARVVLEVPGTVSANI
jgi:hypothetical protein